jgi:hypothetical protein
MLANISMMISFFPRMFMRTPLFYEFYAKIDAYFRTTIKSHTQNKMEQFHSCYSILGRRLFSVAEAYRNENRLRKAIVR